MHDDEATIQTMLARGFVPVRVLVDVIRERDRALLHDVATDDELRSEIERRLGPLEGGGAAV